MTGSPSGALERYLDELRHWGARTNLVGSLAPDELAAHVRDSLAAAPHLPRGAQVVDLGSGAGFPGIPLAIERPDLRLTLVEVRERRVHFLRHVVRTLGLDVAVERTRLEDPPRPEGPPRPEDSRLEDPSPRLADFALIRAVAAPARSLELARPWISESGEIWVWAGPGAELPERAAAAASEAGEISLAPRGSILRVPAAAVSRGTL